MKKIILLITLGLLAMLGFFWLTNTPSHVCKKPINITDKMPKEGWKKFAYSEHCLHQIIRHGDRTSIDPLNQSLDALTAQLIQNKAQGFAVDNIETVLSLYRRDSAVLIQKSVSYLERLHQFDQYKQSHEEPFLSSLEQIGLYELKTSYQNLNTLLKNYVKEPSEESKNIYEAEHKRIRGIICELYLEPSIEKPLFSYLDNHKHYFETISTAYNDIGYERINRLNTDSYIIKSELQLLPSI